MEQATTHCHTCFSNLSCGFADSINRVEDIIEKSYSLGQTGIAITDHECLSSHITALKYYKNKLDKLKDNEEEYNKFNNFKLMLGNEIYLAREDLTSATYKKGEKFYHVILIALDKIGYDILRELSSKAWKRGFFRAIQRRYNIPSDLEIIKQNQGHIIATTACLGGVTGDYFLSNTPENAKLLIDSFLEQMAEIFGKENFFIELAPANREQIDYNKFMYNNYYNKYNFLIATDAHYLEKEDFQVFKDYLNSKSTKEREVDNFYETTYIMSWKEIVSRMNYLPNDFLEECRNNSNSISNRAIFYDLKKSSVIPYIPINKLEVLNDLPYSNKYSFEYIEKYFNSEYLPDRHLLYKIFENYDNLIPLNYNHELVLKRIDLELKELWGISEALNQRMSNYIITMSKIIDVIWNDADTIVGVSRGSAAAFLIDYLVGITQENPLDYPLKIEHWRFLSAERPDLPDIDIDTAGSKREEVIAAVGKYFETFGGSITPICTYGTEGSRSSIINVARGLNIDLEVAQYISSLIPSERGIQWTLDQCYYGDEEHQPIAAFKEQMDLYPRLWEAAKKVEGIVCQMGIHAAGVLITNEPITVNNAVMRTSNGKLVTAWDLHDSEYLGGVKYDFLSVDCLGKIRNTLNFLLQDNLIEWQGSLKATYKKYLWPDQLKEDKKLWENIALNRINSLWQLNTPVGIQALAKVHATSLKEIGIINSLMRLQPQKKGDEFPIDVYVRQKNDIQTWYKEMYSYNLNSDEIKIMEEHLLPLYGVADTQESVMMMTMDKRIAGFSIIEANKLRKGIAKKSKAAQEEAKQLFYSKGLAVGTRKELLDYVWEVQVSRQLGYSFSLPHVAGYSYIALQEANLFTYYPEIYWNTGCLSSEVGSDPEEDFKDLIEKGYIKRPINKRLKIEELKNEFFISLGEEINNYTSRELEEAEQEFINEYFEEEETKKKVIKRGKIAKAISEFQKTTNIEYCDINTSGFGFKPNAANNTITCGLKIVSKIGDNLIEEIINNRPYTSLNDFLNKVKISKDRVVYLIKANAFKNIEKDNTYDLLYNYVLSVSDQKKKLTMQNAQKLIEYKLLPKELEPEIKLFNWMKYIRKNKKDNYYKLDNIAYNYYINNFEEDKSLLCGNETLLEKTYIENIYKKRIDKIKSYIKTNEKELLEKLNNILFQEQWKKYKMDNISQGEMQSTRIYIGKHELSDIKFDVPITKLNEIEEDKVIGQFFIKGKYFPKYEIYHIVGTVINKDKLKNLVTVLTPEGPVDVKVWKNTFALYDQKLVEIKDGEKCLIQDSFFETGTHLLITGIYRSGTFIPKKYKDSKVSDVILKINLNGEEYSYESKINSES